jgi:hypothetical protein
MGRDGADACYFFPGRMHWRCHEKLDGRGAGQVCSGNWKFSGLNACMQAYK